MNFDLTDIQHVTPNDVIFHTQNEHSPKVPQSETPNKPIITYPTVDQSWSKGPAFLPYKPIRFPEDSMPSLRPDPLILLPTHLTHF